MLFALATLTRPVVLLLPLVLVVRLRAVRGSLVAVTILAYTLTLAPWSLRNYIVFDRFVPVSTMAGIVFYQGFHPPEGGWGMTPWREIHELTGHLGSEAEVSSFLIRRTLSDIAAEPAQALATLPLKLAWLVYPFSEVDGRLDLAFVTVAVLGAVAIARRRPRGAAAMPSLTLGYIVFFALVFYGSPRFRLPCERSCSRSPPACSAPRRRLSHCAGSLSA